MKINEIVANFIITILCLSWCMWLISNDNFFKHSITYEEIASDELVESSYSSNLNHYNNSMAAYFDNLTYNFGQNDKGSCCYVALGMMLSYYDTFLNDDIIPEQYDVISTGVGTDMTQRRNSPGILRDILVNPENPSERRSQYIGKLSTKEYYLKLYSMVNQSLHAKLISYSIKDLNYLDAEGSSLGSGVVEMQKILTDEYFKNLVPLVNDKDYSVNFIGYDPFIEDSHAVKDRETLIAYIISNIKKGNPVWIGVSNKTGNRRHACVAYDYNENTGDIYCHMGWGASTTHVTIESQGYYNYDLALIIDFNLPHKHSDNYAVVSENNPLTVKTYCPCSEEISVYTPHSFKCENTDTKFHTYTCECGVVKQANHKYNSGYGLISGILGDIKHNAFCECGAKIVFPHSYSDILGYKYCTKCGWTKKDQVTIIGLGYNEFLEYLN